MNSKAVAAVAPNGLSAAASEPVGPDTEQDIDLLLAFLNTTDAEASTDVLRDAEQWQQWCLEHTGQASVDTTAAREIRDLMRTSVGYGPLTAPRSTPPSTAQWPVHVRLEDGVPITSGTDALGVVLAAASRIAITGRWHRIKICPATNCLRAFYDRSRNRSRTWCSMRVCGNREKARSWRERHAPN
ncbi:CGNR zinc finger domain-containing protein [Actinopolyspora saharensis]|uniref:CGNR zinc finger domain-containing protein n=1 Tax=Actinopolyspora saharensis TaxID=995062 RepID=A0A1H1GAL0_9ACTN|nr:CGNR zinc finger domain-containing protein [Actinopolyspora saharensis]SDR10155.1 CGNR zinc finger domain-containing protein [Actinopolyspora saharensis]